MRRGLRKVSAFSAIHLSLGFKFLAERFRQSYRQMGGRVRGPFLLLQGGARLV